MTEELPPRYDHKSVEEKIYRLWEKSGYFNPDNLPVSKEQRAKSKEGEKKPFAIRSKPFAIIMPPANANGSLHAGHGLVLTIEDIMTRYKRMRGFKTLWLPGLDHAGFETQVVYERQLEKEGRSRFGMEREELYKEIMKFTLDNKKNIEEQTKKMGASCDWSREKFTLDDNIVQTVYATFKKLYDEGLVYRGKKIVNWCPKHQTSLSDLETSDIEQADALYYLRYGPFTIATARPETKFGDKYVVMHPDDKRYKKYKDGDTFELEWINGPIKATVIKDRAIDRAFGTGVMTVTPWHDAIDFELAERHNLEKEQIIDFSGRLLPIAGEFTGMKITEARKKIVEKLASKGLLEKTDENYVHTVKTCYKCGTLIEPQIKEQWFVKMKPLAKPAIKAIETNEVKYIPDHYKKISLHWLKNIMDWNISRQIVWGIRIPAWFCAACGEPKVGPKIKSRWLIVRYGETDWNREHRLMGETDIPLNDTGRKQARETAEKLKNKEVDLIITSHLSRAYETAKIIAEATGAEIVIDKELRECHHGKGEGMLRAEAEKKYGNLRLCEDNIPDSEKYKELEERAWKALMNHKKNHSHKNVVIVSHGAVIRMLRKRIKNWNPEEALAKPPIKNCEIMELELLDEPCSKCGGDLFEQDSDVFDTWFSSGQWPFATLMATTKKMGFHEEVVPQVLDGKTKTYRLRDHEFKVGDRVLFENSATKKIFGYGIITKVEETTIDKINYRDKSHYKTYKNLGELMAAFKHKNPERVVTPKTPAYLYAYEFHPTKNLKTDFETFYPTDVMETAGEIIFFWVARMIMFGLYVAGKVPFRTVYLHGLVLDARGKKMSKSRGNVINPLDLTEKYGTDAFRIGLIIGNTPGTSLALDENRIRGYRNFSTKIWNAARFVIMNRSERKIPSSIRFNKIQLADIKDFEKVKNGIAAHLDRFELHLAAEKAYHYFWHTFADKLVEREKKSLRDGGATAKIRSYAFLEFILAGSIKFLHPFMPFITEEIYQKLRPNNLLIAETW